MFFPELCYASKGMFASLGWCSLLSLDSPFISIQVVFVEKEI